MQHQNFSRVTEILLLGIQNFQNVHFLVFLLLLIIYCVTVCGNLLIILVVSSSRSLHYPMYIFLTQLSLSDILLSTTIEPNMLHVELHQGSSVSFVGCLTQFHFFAASIALDCLLLTAMSYDRYQAICNPLHYNSIMNMTFCLKVILSFWLMALIMVIIMVFTLIHLDFCGPNIIDHFFCDLEPILELSCSDTFIMKMETLFFATFFTVCPLIIIIISYVYIIFTILKIPSVTGRKKTFSTCSAHLSAVCIFYVSLIIIYIFPRQLSSNTLLSLLYTVVTPLINPMIYGLSNRDIKEALRKLFTNIYLSIFSNFRTISLPYKTVKSKLYV